MIILRDYDVNIFGSVIDVMKIIKHKTYVARKKLVPKSNIITNQAQYMKPPV